MVDASGQPLETALRRRLQKDFEADIREWLEVRMEAINGDMDLLLNPHLGARELRLVLKQKSQTQLRHEYARHVHGVLLRVIGTAFATLPSIQQLIISGYSQRLNPATGHVEDEYLISARVERTAFEQINFDNLEEVDPIMAMERFELVREMSKSFQFTRISPLCDPLSDAALFDAGRT